MSERRRSSVAAMESAKKDSENKARRNSAVDWESMQTNPSEISERKQRRASLEDVKDTMSGKISKEEVQSITTDFVGRGNSKLGFAEFKHLMVLFRITDNTMVEQCFKSFSDKSGTVDVRMFMSGLTSLMSSSEDDLLFAFKLFDLDGDGFVSKAEVGSLLSSYLSMRQLFSNKAHPDNVQRLVKDMFTLAESVEDPDAHKDHMTLNQFVHVMEAMPALAANLHDDEDGQVDHVTNARRTSVADIKQTMPYELSDLEMLHNYLMQNGTEQFVDKSEFSCLLWLFNIQDTALIDRYFHAFDVDGSGSIDIKMFLSHMAALQKGEDSSAALEFAFNLYDGDEDGLITHDEYVRLLSTYTGAAGAIIDEDELGEILDLSFNLAPKKAGEKLDLAGFKAAIGSQPQLSKLFMSVDEGVGDGKVKTDEDFLLETATDFFNACESGKGWKACALFCHPAAGFSCQAVDALPGPPVTACTTTEQYAEWMGGVVQNMGDKATYELLTAAVDGARDTVTIVGLFGGFSQYVYMIHLSEGKIDNVTKIWNDQYAFKIISSAS